MRSQFNYKSLLFFLALSSCFKVETVSDRGNIGKIPTFFNSTYLTKTPATDHLALVDQKLGRLLDVSLDPLRINSNVSLAFEEKGQVVLSDANDNFHIAVSAENYSIVKKDQTATKDPVALSAEIRDFSFDFDNRFLVLIQENNTILILKLAADGSIEKSWTGNQVIEGSTFTEIGDILTNGSLLLAIDAVKLAVVDLNASVTQEKWVYSAFDLTAAYNITWIARVPYLTGSALVFDGKRLLLVDAVTKTITQEKNVENQSWLLDSKKDVPHVILSDNVSPLETAWLYYVDKNANLVNVEFMAINSQLYSSILDPDLETLAVIYNQDSEITDQIKDDFSNKTIKRYLVSDGSEKDISKTVDFVKLSLTAEYLLLQFESPLGKIERRTYGENPATKDIKGYNFEIIREKYQEE